MPGAVKKPFCNQKGFFFVIQSDSQEDRPHSKATLGTTFVKYLLVMACHQNNAYFTA
jgi:hypothetical protein